MKYQDIRIPAQLRMHVKQIWMLEQEVMGKEQYRFQAIPDGSPGLIFQQSNQGGFFQGATVLPHLYLYGQTVRPLTFCAPQLFRTIGIYFYPHALKSVFGLDAYELTDNCVDLELFPSVRGLTQQLLNTQDALIQITLLCHYLNQLLYKHERLQDIRLHGMLEQISYTKGLITPIQLRHDSGLTERGLERKFRQYVGIPPKQLSGIIRFQVSLKQLLDKDYNKISDIAFEQEYTDQSHFNRVFRAYTGYTPGQYRGKTKAIVDSFPQLC